MLSSYGRVCGHVGVLFQDYSFLKKEIVWDQINSRVLVGYDQMNICLGHLNGCTQNDTELMSFSLQQMTSCDI